MWAARVRQPNLTLADDLIYRSAILTEGYNSDPDTLLITGRLSDLAVAMDPGSGIRLLDHHGNERFTGYADELERLGNGMGTILYRSDLEDLRYRWVWPVPAAAWKTGQTTATHDILTASAENRLIWFVDRHAGPSAYHSGTIDRRIPGLSMPTTGNRGPSARTAARFNNLLELAAALAETGSLRMRLEWSPGALALKLDSVPDLRGVTRFGDANAGAGNLLGEDWRYKIGAPKASVVLSANNGSGTSRNLDLLDKTAAAESVLWKRYRESFLNQSGTSDASEIAETMASAYADAAGLREIAAPIVPGGLEFGTDIPCGSLVSAVLDGQVIEERVRQIVTEITAGESDATMKVSASIGSPDAGPAIPSQRFLARAYARIREVASRVSYLERS